MTPLAHSNLEHGQDIISSESEHVETPVDHDEYIQQASKAPPTAISTDQLLTQICHWILNFMFPLKILLAQIQLNQLICQTRILVLH